MSNPEILSIISIAVTAIVGIILSRQIKSQQQIIGQYKDLLQTLDLNKIKEFHELDKKAILSQVKLELNNFHEQNAATFGRQFDEMASYISDQLIHFTKDQRDEIIKRHLPHSQKLFFDHFRHIEDIQKGEP